MNAQHKAIEFTPKTEAWLRKELGSDFDNFINFFNTRKAGSYPDFPDPEGLLGKKFEQLYESIKQNKKTRSYFIAEVSIRVYSKFIKDFPNTALITDELKKALEYILQNRQKFGFPEFNGVDFFHAHLINRRGTYGFLFHTKEYVGPFKLGNLKNWPKDDPYKNIRNIVFWFGAKTPQVVKPQSNNSVVDAEDLGAKLVSHEDIYFHPTQEFVRPYLSKCDVTTINLRNEFTGENLTLYVAIPKF